MSSPNTSAATSLVNWPSPSTAGSTTIAALLPLLPLKWGGDQGSGAVLTCSFAWIEGRSATFSGPEGQPYSSLNEPGAAYHYGLNAVEQAAARQAFNAWADVAKLTFREVAETSTEVGDIRLAWTSATETTSTGGRAWGWANYPDDHWPSAGDIWLSSVSSGATDSDWGVGSYNALAMMHEIGHALGLKHSFSGLYTLPTALDTRSYTLMSYTDAQRSEWVNVTSTPSGGHTWGSQTIFPSTPMVGDILAIQYLYGANTSTQPGDNLYDFDPTQPFYQTLWDTGGQDTISAARFVQPCTINLNEGSYSSLGFRSNWFQYSQLNWTATPDLNTLYDGSDNLGIAWGVVIENATGGSGNDTLTGNPANNRLQGGAGNDTLDGGLGTDTAIYAQQRSHYRLEQTSSGWRITDTVGNAAAGDGADTLLGIERLRFADRQVALDLDGHAGTVARIVGAVFGQGAVLAHPEYIGIGLQHMDTLGENALALAGLALREQVGSNPSPEQVVTLLFTNVLHQAPTPAQRDVFVNQLKAGVYTYASLTEMAALTPENAISIQLSGLSSSGLDYLSFSA